MHPEDPRLNPQHRERGPKRFGYTYTDLAGLLGIKESYLKKLVFLKKIDPADLRSIAGYYLERLEKGKVCRDKHKPFI